MNFSRFEELFEAATGQPPYAFQTRFAEAEMLPQLVNVPTGAGKTAMAVLGWLWRRQFASEAVKDATPRRLVYCLPMRVLVEQSVREVTGWMSRLNLDVQVHILMGGVDAKDWHMHPEKEAILIGTQDMLLSRVLNRGYAADRFHWPIDFGLLNNDSLWVFDEPQLMGNGVSTSAQMAGFRKKMLTYGPCQSSWMSATLEPEWLDTVDFPGEELGKVFALGKDRYGDDYERTKPLYKRMTAQKTLARLDASSSKDMKEVVSAILGTGAEPGLHREGTQTLVVLNTVDRAKAVFEGLKKRRNAALHLLLVHSRFRPAERENLNKLLQEKGEIAKDRIIVATQVVEAGVDISCPTLITELAPWASIVQRIGRCNRTGDDGPGEVFWIDLNDDKLALPYEKTDLIFAREQLVKLQSKSVSPKDLEDFKTQQKIALPFVHKHVLRRRDILELFDTAPDLSGNDIDIARFVRSDDPDTDVQVFWRDVSGGGPSDDEPTPGRRELCNVPVGQARSALENFAHRKVHGYVWDHLGDEWRKIDPKQVRPGIMILLPATAGGYSELGWDVDSKSAVTPIPPAKRVRGEAAQSDPYSATPAKLTIFDHTKNVCRELAAALEEIGELVTDQRDNLQNAARWHDVGKGHHAFQVGMRNANPSLDPTQLWAKSGTTARLRHGRKYFRHELASALAVMQQRHDWPYTTAYLIAAHHGKVRLSIRSLPGEESPEDPETLFALGVHNGDELPEVQLDGGNCPKTTLDLSPMQLGGEKSWTANALNLLGELGPFKLAYLEALLRAADVRASKKEAEHA